MKKVFTVLLGIAVVFLLAGCWPFVTTEPAYGYKLNMEVVNESTSNVEVEVYACFVSNESNEIYSILYKVETLTVESNKSASISESVCEALCAPPCLTHIYKIGEKIYTDGKDIYEGAWEELAVLDNPDKENPAAEVKPVVKVAGGLGTVDFTKDSSLPYLTYNGKSYHEEGNITVKNKLTISGEGDISFDVSHLYTK